jgi:preprotein translocase subunit YajC
MLQPVGPKAGTPGTAAPDSPAGAGAPAAPAPAPNMWIMVAPLLVVMVVMLFTNRNQRKRDAETRAKLKKGDRVVSTSGLVGELVDMDERFAKVKIAPGTNVQMLIGSVSPFEPVAATSSKDDKSSLKDLKDAKATAEKKA